MSITHKMPYEWLIGLRYTRAKRRNHFISFISLISMLGIGLGTDGLMYGMDPHSLEVLGISPERLMHLMDDIGPLVSTDPIGAD